MSFFTLYVSTETLDPESLERIEVFLLKMQSLADIFSVAWFYQRHVFSLLGSVYD